MREIGFALLATLAAQTALPAQSNPLDVASRRQVFIDGRFLEVSDGVELVVHQPVKTNELTIAPEHPWETVISGSSTVIKAGECLSPLVQRQGSQKEGSRHRRTDVE